MSDREEIYDSLLARARKERNFDEISIKGIWEINLNFKPSKNERLFTYKVIVVQTTYGQGSCYASPNESFGIDRTIIGKTLSEVDMDNDSAFPLKVAILDSVYDTPRIKPDLEVEIRGDSTSKSRYRAEIIASEVSRIINGKQARSELKSKVPVILNIGYVGTFYTILTKSFNPEYLVTDLEEELLSTKGQVDIFDGNRYNKEFLKKADVAIVTGMVISTRTLSEIIETARKNNTSVLVFAETGYNLAPYYRDFGVDVSVSEPFPYYIFDGASTMRVFRKQ
ncbi:MAG: Rossmann-like domain-containing protein [Thermoplasmataceae archaeon]